MSSILIQQIKKLELDAEDLKLIKSFLWNELLDYEDGYNLTALGVTLLQACVQRGVPIEQAARIFKCSERFLLSYIEKQTKN